MLVTDPAAFYMDPLTDKQRAAIRAADSLLMQAREAAEAGNNDQAEGLRDQAEKIYIALELDPGQPGQVAPLALDCASA